MVLIPVFVSLLYKLNMPLSHLGINAGMSTGDKTYFLPLRIQELY